MGRSSRHFLTKARKDEELKLPPEAERILEEAEIEVGEWCSPATGGDAEFESLSSQTRNVKAVEAVPADQEERAIDIMVQRYPKTKETIEHCLSDSHLIVLMKHVNMKASPGFPLGLLFPTNKQLVETPPAFRYVIDLARWRVRALSRIDPKWLEAKLAEDPTWAIRMNLCDPIRNFVKKEPHSGKKRKERRWRLINSLSITDQLVERMLFTTQDQAEINIWQHIPSKSGMGLNDESVTELLKYAADMGLTVSNDVKGWDMNAPDQLIRMDAKARIRLNTSGDAAWANAVMSVTTLHSHRVLMLTDGRCYKRSILGGQASGRKVTSSSNGRARGFIDILMSMELGYVPAFMTQGDDNVARIPESVSLDTLQRRVKERFNVTMTDVVRDESKIYFCSQEMFWEDGEVRCIPQTPQKQLVRMLMATSDDNAEEGLYSLELNLRHHPQLDVYLAAARAVLAAR